jgi:hypothetical protein
MKKKDDHAKGNGKFSFAGFSYQHFALLGRGMKRAFYGGSGVDEALEDAGVRIYPDAYYCIIGFLFLLSFIIVLPVVVLTGAWFIILFLS